MIKAEGVSFEVDHAHVERRGSSLVRDCHYDVSLSATGCSAGFNVKIKEETIGSMKMLAFESIEVSDIVIDGWNLKRQSDPVALDPDNAFGWATRKAAKGVIDTALKTMSTTPKTLVSMLETKIHEEVNEVIKEYVREANEMIKEYWPKLVPSADASGGAGPSNVMLSPQTVGKRKRDADEE